MNQVILQVPKETTQPENVDVAKVFDYLMDSRGMIILITLVCLLGGGLYALLATPVYETNLLIQVEDMSGSSTSGGTPKNIQGDLSSAFDIKTATASEIEIVRSRTVVARAVENAKLYIEIEPNYFPGIGAWIARLHKDMSTPGLFGYGGYVWGGERASVSTFDVPLALEGKEFTLTAGEGGSYRVSHEELGIGFDGRVGELLKVPVAGGQIDIMVDRLAANPGGEFHLTRHPRLETVKQLQNNLKITENGKQSGIIGVTLAGSNPEMTSLILNEIGREYIQQNLDRKSEKAKKSLMFLDRQLPDLKQELDESENKYRELRHRYGAIDIGEEAKAMLQQSVTTELRLSELDQKKLELLTRYEPAHPAIEAIAVQEKALKARVAALNARIKELPAIEQEMVRLSRDVKVNTELYTTLLGTAQQLRLATSSEVGNARLLDEAAVPIKPVKPHRLLIVMLSGLGGVLLGVALAFARKVLYGKIDDPEELEATLGLPVCASIPYSPVQEKLYRQALLGGGKPAVLPHDTPDNAVESLRRLRASLQYIMRDAPNNIIMITGPTQRVGKSFVCANFSTVMASIGKRVLLIDADLRAGDLHRYFNAERTNGLAEVLLEEGPLERLIQRDVAENLDFLSTGRLPAKPAELLAHPRFARLLQYCASRYDFVIVDSAPVLAVSDALSVAPHIGVILNIVRGGVTTASEIEETVKRLNQTGQAVTGVVLNGSRARHAPYGYGEKVERKRYLSFKPQA